MALSADDHEAIRALLARYNFAIDLGDADAWAGCFTETGTFECTGLPEDSPLAGRFEGRDALAAYARTHLGLNKGLARHWNWNLLIDGDGDEATMRCYLLALRAGQGPDVKMAATGIYEDRLVRTADGWRFAARHIRVDPQPA